MVQLKNTKEAGPISLMVGGSWLTIQPGQSKECDADALKEAFDGNKVLQSYVDDGSLVLDSADEDASTDGGGDTVDGGAGGNDTSDGAGADTTDGGAGDDGNGPQLLTMDNSKAELVAAAMEAEIDGADRMNKSELIVALQAEGLA